MGQSLRNLPVAHKVVIGIAGAVLGMAGFLFVQWISAPSYAVLYTGLDDTQLGEVVDELERNNVAYQLESGGSRVLVPASDVQRVRASLATAGIQASGSRQGYELIDGQGLNVSDFRQRIDLQRALEGELARTLSSMDGIVDATVHLVLPEQTLFSSESESVTASVLLTPARNLTALEVETVTFLVASAVEGLEPGGVTVADVGGAVLASGDLAGGSAITNRNMRMTQDYENALAADAERLLAAAIGFDRASVVVRAELDFDELSTEAETYDAGSAVVLRQQRIDETFNGAGTPAAGTVGVDGIPAGEELDNYDYTRSEVTEESGVDRVLTRTVKAPGRIRSLSVAVVMDDGSLTGATVPEVSEVSALLTAALGLDTTRGDAVAVTAVPFAAPEVVADAEGGTEATAAASASAGPTEMIPQAAGALVTVLVALALLLMTRKSKKGAVPLAPAAALPAATGATAAIARAGSPTSSRPDVIGLIEQQPEEIAVLLRGWLADRR